MSIFDQHNFLQSMPETQTLWNDFCFTDLYWEIGFEFSTSWHDNMTIAENKLEEWENVKIDTECWERDWMFDDKQRFIVYSKEDVQKMITALQGTLI